MNTEFELEKILKIKTTGRDDTNSNLTNYPYEATSYNILRELAYSGYINQDDTIIDYGSGKGRVDFYLAYYTKCKMIGIEFDERLYNRSLDNHKTGKSSKYITFINTCASKYEVPNETTGAYFFNPFSILILKQVLQNLKNKNKEIKLFFYYPSDEYLNVLDNDKDIEHLEDIDCKNLFKKDDKREYIAVYKIKN